MEKTTFAQPVTFEVLLKMNEEQFYDEFLKKTFFEKPEREVIAGDLLIISVFCSNVIFLRILEKRKLQGKDTELNDIPIYVRFLIKEFEQCQKLFSGKDFEPIKKYFTDAENLIKKYGSESRE